MPRTRTPYGVRSRAATSRTSSFTRWTVTATSWSATEPWPPPSPACLTRLTLCVDQLQAERVSLQFPPGEDSSSGPVSLPAPPGVKLIKVTTAEEMAVLVAQQAGSAEVIVKSAAVADFRPAAYQEQKIKKRQAGLALELVKNTDILMELGRKRRPGQLLVGFAAESGDHEAEGRRKLTEKNLDLIVVNDILGKQTGFDVETNQVTLIDKADSLVLPLLSKEDTADRIWDKVVALLGAAT